MSRDFHFPKDVEGLSHLIKKIVAAPEFCFCEGDFLKRLEHMCYYQLGNFQYPVKILLSHLFSALAEKFEIAILIQDIHLKIVKSPVYEIFGEGAIMSQDVNHVIGPVEDLIVGDDKDLERELEKTLLSLENFSPHRLGEILVSSPHWCRSRYLLEAVIYHFEAKEITTEEVVRATMHKCLERCNSLGIQKVAMDALGTEYYVLSHHRFVHILHETLLKLAGRLPNLKELAIAACDQQHANALKKAFADVLNIKMP